MCSFKVQWTYYVRTVFLFNIIALSSTVQGPADNPGLNQRALRELFQVVEERHSDHDYSIMVSVLEIYNECVRDLLSTDPTQKLDIKQGPDGVYVPGLTQVAISQLDEVNEVNIVHIQYSVNEL